MVKLLEQIVFFLIFSKAIGKCSSVQLILLARDLLVSGKKKGKNVLIRGTEHYINTRKEKVLFLLG